MHRAEQLIGMLEQGIDVGEGPAGSDLIEKPFGAIRSIELAVVRVLLDMEVVEKKEVNRGWVHGGVRACWRAGLRGDGV